MAELDTPLESIVSCDHQGQRWLETSNDGQGLFLREPCLAREMRAYVSGTHHLLRCMRMYMWIGKMCFAMIVKNEFLHIRALK